jgi:putative ABC transport system substrate-binding protein
MITRRGLIAVGLGVLAARAAAQTPNLPLVGVLLITDPVLSYTWKRLVEDMLALGYVDGTNVRYAARFTQDPAQLPALAAEIASLSPRVVYANGDEAARVAASQWSTIPIVAMTDDHIGAGLTDSYARPSRNVTGVSRLEAELDTKRLELLHELVPSAQLILVLRDPQTVWSSRTEALEQAAARSGVELDIRDVRAVGDVNNGIGAGRAEGAQALLVLGSPLLTAPQFATQIRETALTYRLPTMVQIPRAVAYGDLASYGIDQDAVLLRLAAMIDRILKGAKPGSLPIEQPTKFVLVINLKTAKALGLTVPQSLLARADEVIE